MDKLIEMKTIKDLKVFTNKKIKNKKVPSVSSTRFLLFVEHHNANGVSSLEELELFEVSVRISFILQLISYSF